MGVNVKKSNKKILIIILGIVLFLFILGSLIFFFKGKSVNNDELSIEKKEEKVATATPLFYEVSKEGINNKIYLFGSIHAADERAYPMQNKIMEAYNNSDYLAVELDLIAFKSDLSAQMKMLQMFLCENGKTLKDYLSSEGYEIIIEYMKDNGIYISAYEMYRPAMIYSLLSNVTIEKSKLDSKKGIDMYFLSEAKEDKKEILEIESAQMQYSLLSSLPDELYELIILSYIEQEEQEISGLKELYEGWLRGDIKSLVSSDDFDINKIKEGLTEEEKFKFDKEMELLNDFNNELINNRNDGMNNVIDNYFKEGKNVFVVVGAAHVVGDNGLVNSLVKSGYNVSLIDYK